MSEQKSTIFVTISTGMIARNILLSTFFEKLKQHYRVVLFATLHQDPDFLALAGEGVAVEKLHFHRRSRFEEMLYAIHKGFIYNQTVEIRSRYGLAKKQEGSFKKAFFYWLQRIIFGIVLSKMKILRRIARSVDRFLYHTDRYTPLFEQYKPSLVFITNMTKDADLYMAREARRQGVHTVGMAKSWDNLSKVGLRERTDRFVVWNDFMKQEAIEFQGYAPEEVTVVGVPQFDIYHERIMRRYSKRDFTDVYGLDPQKRIILFGQRATPDAEDDAYVVSVIKKWITNERKPYQILIRPHFGYRGSDQFFREVVDNRTVFIDTKNTPSLFQDGWDYSPEHYLRLALSIAKSDLIITSTSTLVLDAIAAGKRVLCYCFDKDKGRPFGESMRRRFETLWFRAVRLSGLEPHIMRSEEELLRRIETELRNSPSATQAGYEGIIRRFCYKVDGESGERLFEALVGRVVLV